MKRSFFVILFVTALMVFIPMNADAYVNAKGIVLEGEELKLEVPPVIENGRTLVPVRGVLEALGATVEWNQATKTVTAYLGELTTSVTVDKHTASIDGYVINLDVPAKIVDGRTMVPLRFMAEALGYDVSYSDGWVFLEVPQDEYSEEFQAALDDFSNEFLDGELKDFIDDYSVFYLDDINSAVFQFEKKGFNSELFELLKSDKPKTEWIEVKDSMEDVSLAMREYFESRGFSLNCIVEVLDDADTENILLQVTNGVVTYDVADHVVSE